MPNAKTFLIIGAAAALALAACGSGRSGGGGLCAAVSKCSADPPQPQTQIDICNIEVSGACGSEYNAAGNCSVAQQVCGADNKTNVLATQAGVEANCRSLWNAYNACCAQNPSDEGCCMSSPSGCPL
jgi:hypothetical protein